MCGYRADPQVLTEYIQSTLRDSSPNVSRRSATIKTVPQQSNKNTELMVSVTKQKGITVTIGGHRFEDKSVSKLYGQILQFLYDNGYIETLKPYLPFATSQKRYLLAAEPFHPNGNEFKVPVEYNGYYMEAHKDYHNAVSHLARLLKLCALEVKYIQP